MIPQFLSGPFWWYKHDVLVGVVLGVVLMSGASILVPVGVLVGSGADVACAAVVVVHSLCVRSSRMRVALGSSFCRTMLM